MIYFETAHIAKCYLNEPGADRVREVAYGADGLASVSCPTRVCIDPQMARQRASRDAPGDDDDLEGVRKRSEERRVAVVWSDTQLLEDARKAVLNSPSTVFVRSGDALHLACAEEHGFDEVYTNDRHMLEAARYFHVTGVNVLSDY